MIRDVFYFNDKPNVHPREKHATDLAHARAQSTTEHFWIINEFCLYQNFDWAWDFDFLDDEDVWAESHNNVWPSQHQKDSGTWLCPTDHSGVVLYRADVDPIQRKNSVNDHWNVLQEVENTFDFSWHPDAQSPPYIYQFGTQWQRTGGPQYIVAGATETKFVDCPTAVVKADKTHWEIDDGVDTTSFDFSWHPDSTSPPYIYQFGTLLDDADGPRYLTPDHTTKVPMTRPDVILSELVFSRYHITTTLEALIDDHPGEIFWALNPDLDYSGFDFKWIPTAENVYHVNAFGSADSINTQTYFVNGKMWQKGYRDINYIDDMTLNVTTTIDMFFVDRGNSESTERFKELQLRFPTILKTRYLNSWVDTINRCTKRASTKLCWVLNSELDYRSFEFDYYPSPWQMNMVHVFGTQWSHWGTTFIVNKNTFAYDTQYINIIEHLPNLNFVKRIKAHATNCIYDICVIDHGNVETMNIVGELSHRLPMDKTVTVLPYKNSYLETFKLLLTTLIPKREHYLWVCSSICDYSSFDFSYICDPFAREQLHVFPSDKQKFGDTFLIDVNKLRVLVDTMSTLDEYEKISYNQHQRVRRISPPVITVTDDTHCSAIHTEFNFPYAVFTTEPNNVVDAEPMNLWSASTKSIIVTSSGGSRIVVPREASKYVKRELYDYPYIKKLTLLTKSAPLDIVFLSNGEACANDNYEHLLQLTKNLPNRVIRIDGVTGRVNSQHAAANAANTPWYFLVNGKLRVADKFDFAWQPDRLQIAKHYIFTATNPVNTLEYGHQAIVANNKMLTLNTVVRGLDFTMDSEHEVVNVNSGVGMFNSSAWDTWRTAFREVLKLQAYVSANDDLEARYRLSTWLNLAEGDFAKFSTSGAQHAIDYFKEVEGDDTALKLSYDWLWLRTHFDSLYPK